MGTTSVPIREAVFWFCLFLADRGLAEVLPSKIARGWIHVGIGTIGILYGVGVLSAPSTAWQMRLYGAGLALALIVGLTLALRFFNWQGLGFRWNAAATDQRFTKLAEVDVVDANLEQLIRINDHGEARPNFDAIEPDAELTVGIQNCSVFRLTLQRLENHLEYEDHRLHQQPVPPTSFSLEHGQYKPLTLRQVLQPQTAAHMKAQPVVVFAAGHFALWFAYEDHLGQRREIRKAFPNEYFTWRPATSPVPSIESIPLSRSIFISRIEANFLRLAEDSLLEISVTAFSGDTVPISVDPHIGGLLRLSWGTDNKKEQDLLLAGFSPQLDNKQSSFQHVPRCVPFRLLLKQPLSANVANDIWVAFCNRKSFEFDFRELLISVSRDATPGSTERFPLWQAVRCWKAQGEEVIQVPVLGLTLKDTVTLRHGK